MASQSGPGGPWPTGARWRVHYYYFQSRVFWRPLPLLRNYRNILYIMDSSEHATANPRCTCQQTAPKGSRHSPSSTCIPGPGPFCAFCPLPCLSVWYCRKPHLCRGVLAGPSRAIPTKFDSSGGRIAGLDEDLVDPNVLGLGQRPDHSVGHVDRIEPHISVLGCLSEEAARLLVRRTRGQLRAAVARLDRGHFDAGADALGAQSL